MLKDRESIRGHGDVCIYVRSDLKSFEILSIGKNERGVEQIWCGIRTGEEKIIVGCMYRPPYSDPSVLRVFLNSIQRAKEKVDSGDFKSSIVCGDFNLPKINWPETGCWVNQGGQEEEDFLNECYYLFMTQVISRSNFGPNGMGGNILDLVLTSDTSRILEVEYGSPLGNVKIGHATINITRGIKVESEENP